MSNKILTVEGYKDWEEIFVGTQVVAYDTSSGKKIVNEITSIETWTDDEDYKEAYGDFVFYSINEKYKLYKNQSVWANGNIKHAFMLHVGDIIYNDKDEDVEITSISETTDANWHRVEIDGDHSYIEDGIQLHNASRYWVGGGSSVNWNATSSTNWSASSGGARDASVPSTADIATFDTNSNSNNTISADISVIGWAANTDYTATTTRGANITIGTSGCTLGANATYNGTGGMLILTTATLTSNGKIWGNNLSQSGTNTTSRIWTFNDNWTIGKLSIQYRTITLNGVGLTLTCTDGLNLISTLAGTMGLKLTGGDWVGTAPGNIEIDGDITLGNCAVSGGKLSYTSGAVRANDSTTFTITSTTTYTIPDLSSWDFYNFAFSGGNNSPTLSSDLYLRGNLRLSPVSSACVLTGQTIHVGGGISQATGSGSNGGTTKIVMTGTGTFDWSTRTTGSYNLSTEFNTDGIISFSGTDYQIYGSEWKFTKGTFVDLDKVKMTFQLGDSETAIVTDTDGIVFNKFYCSSTANQNSVTFRGTFPVGVNTFELYQTDTNYTTPVILSAGSTLNILQNFTNENSQPDIGYRFYFKSDTPNTPAYINLAQNASQNLQFVNFTDIDSSDGKTIYTYRGVLTRTVNINSITNATPTTQWSAYIG